MDRSKFGKGIEPRKAKPSYEDETPRERAVKKQPEETTDEKTLGKVIAAELRRQLGSAESDCPETETVAAFYDRTLSERERADWEKHFLHCLRCQEYLAELARLADADEPPKLLGEEAEEVEADASPSWFYRLAWAIPFLIIGVTSAVIYKEDIDRFLERHQETAMITPAPALPAEQSPPIAGAKGEEHRAAVDKDLAKSVPGPATLVAKNKTEAGRSTPSGMVAQAKGQAGAGMATPRERMDLRDAAKVAEPSLQSEVAEKKSADYVAPPAAAAAARQNAPGEMNAAGAPARPSTAMEAESASPRKETSALGRLTVQGVERKAAAKWRVARSGTIQKADEAGNWKRIVSGVADDLFDITFAGTTGWAVGHGGAVLRSTDGGDTWQKVAAPTTEDLVHVSSQNAQQAQVISRSGKTFTTTDGGQTWK